MNPTPNRIYLLAMLLALGAAGCKQQSAARETDMLAGALATELKKVKSGPSPGVKALAEGRTKLSKEEAAKTAGCGNGQCEFASGEDCRTCPGDCSKCDGCQDKHTPGCPGCKCEACVCKEQPHCCDPKKSWDGRCIKACEKDCGGCGLVDGAR